MKPAILAVDDDPDVLKAVERNSRQIQPILAQDRCLSGQPKGEMLCLRPGRPRSGKGVEKNTDNKDTRYSGSQTGHGFMVTF